MKDGAATWASKTAAGVIGILLLGSFLVQVAKVDQRGSTGQPCAGPQSGIPASFPVGTNSSSNDEESQSNSSAGSNSTAQAGPVELSDAVVELPATDLDLTALATLPISNNSPTVSDLANVTYWKEVVNDWGADLAEILPQTVVGYMNDSGGWRSWALQYMPEPPAWFSVGFIPYYYGSVFDLDRAGGTETGQAALANIRQYAASAAGYSLAALDFVTFNGLTALRTYFETGSASAAICQTFPAELAALYSEAFDQSVPSDTRAQYLGQALAITTLMLALGGAKDSGFFSKFQGAIDDEGLGDSWPTVKPYLAEITDEASGAASSATLAILQTLAGRFPQDSGWVDGLTAARVDAMVQVLGDKGLPDDVVESDIQKVAQAASTSPNEDGAAEVADDRSYVDGDWIQVSVRSQGRISLYVDGTGRTESIQASFLQANVPGFDPTKPDFVQITYQGGPSVYNYYGGPGDTADGVDASGTTWTPKAPASIAQPGTIVNVQFSLVTPESFASTMPPLEYSSFMQDAPWMTFGSELTGYSVSGTDLTISVTQDPFDGLSITSFQIDGEQTQLNWDGKVTSLDFKVVDAFGESTELRLVYNGYSDPQLRISSGGTNDEFSPVSLVSFDGVKLKFLEGTGGGETSEQTIYVQAPTSLYTLSQMDPGDSSYLTAGGSAVYQIDQVTPTRAQEYTMVTQGGTYDKGVVGAEIAYVVGTNDLGLQGLILPEQAEGGADLYTPGHAVVIQARLIDLRGETTTVDIQSDIQAQLLDMVGQLKQDFSVNKAKGNTVDMGYAIISYIDSQNVIHTVILEVPPPS
ncbi:MAG: hypothetical protein ABSF83_01560 [Nitrososphaerales archaeon]|jgi:hypothetical protein